MDIKRSLQLFIILLYTPFPSQSTTFTFGEWSGSAIHARVSDPTDDTNSINSAYDCRSQCSYGVSLYVVRKDGKKVSGGSTNESWIPWGVVGREAIVNYLQNRFNTYSSTMYFPTSVKLEDVRMICMNAWISNRVGYQDLVIADTCGSGGGTIPPLPNQPFCRTSDQIELDHGLVHDEGITGQHITKNISFMCNENIPSTLTISNSDVMMSGPSSLLTSKVLIDGKSQLKIYMQEGNNTYSLSSELNSAGTVKPGSYTGSTVLIWLPD